MSAAVLIVLFEKADFMIRSRSTNRIRNSNPTEKKRTSCVCGRMSQSSSHLWAATTLQKFRQGRGSFADLQSGQRFVLLEQQLWQLAEAVLVQATAAGNRQQQHKEQQRNKKNCPHWGRAHARLNRRRFSQPLQLLQVIESSSFHQADLVLHQVAANGNSTDRESSEEKKPKKRRKNGV